MSQPNYAEWTDQDLLVLGRETLANAFTDTSGSDDERWEAVLNAALESLQPGRPIRELAKRNRKWGQPVTPPTDPRTLPPSVPIVDNPNGLGIA